MGQVLEHDGVLELTPEGAKPAETVINPPVDQLPVFVCDAGDGRLLATLEPANFAPLGVTADGEFWLETHVANRVLALRPNVWTRGSTVEYETIRYEADITHAVGSPDGVWLGPTPVG